MRTDSRFPFSRAVTLAAVLAAPVLAPFPASAQEGGSATVQALRDELAAVRREYEQRLAELEARVSALAALAAARAPAPAPEVPPAPPVSGATVGSGSLGPAGSAGSAGSGNYFNPSISMIANVLGSAGHNPVADSPGLSLSESELSLQAVIDPYARADFFLGFSEAGVEVEEGYATFTALPWQLLGKVGRQRIAFGKINTLHSHALPWADVPLPNENLIGGEEGWKDDGVTIARLIPLGDTFSELTVQLLRGEAEGLFHAERRRDLAANLHYRLFRDLSDASNLDLGLSFARGHNDAGPDSSTTLAGLDFTWRFKPLQTALYRGTTVRGELVTSRREQPEGVARAVGWFVAADFQVARRFSLGARLESSERATDAALRDDGGALTATFRPSEFQLVRAELRRRRYAERLTADELFVQLQFLIGAHGAHPF